MFVVKSINIQANGYGSITCVLQWWGHQYTGRGYECHPTQSGPAGALAARRPIPHRLPPSTPHRVCQDWTQHLQRRHAADQISRPHICSQGGQVVLYCKPLQKNVNLTLGICIFSSPEHKVLMVSYCGQWLSVVVRRASCVVRQHLMFTL